jgi:hypothetical protein
MAGAPWPAADAVIGVLCLETEFTKIPGHIRNPATFGFPVTYRVVRGATPERVVSQADPTLLAPFISAARELAGRGVAAITSGCGFLVLFQPELAAAVDVPLYASSLIQLPMVAAMLRPDQAVGLLVAKKESLTPRHLAAIGGENVPVRVAGLAGRPEFREVMLEGRRTELDVGRLRLEVLAEAEQLAERHPELGALIIECTDLVPFASAIQDRIKMPVFDIVTMTSMVHQSLTRRPYA